MPAGACPHTGHILGPRRETRRTTRPALSLRPFLRPPPHHSPPPPPTRPLPGSVPPTAAPWPPARASRLPFPRSRGKRKRRRGSRGGLPYRRRQRPPPPALPFPPRPRPSPPPLMARRWGGAMLPWWGGGSAPRPHRLTGRGGLSPFLGSQRQPRPTPSLPRMRVPLGGRRWRICSVRFSGVPAHVHADFERVASLI